MKGLHVVARTAERQAGLISRQQLLRLQFSIDSIRRACASRVLLRHQRGVYRVPGAPLSDATQLWAAVLWGNFQAFLSHRTAAWWGFRLSGLGRFPPKTIELVTKVNSGWVAPPGICIRRVTELEPRDTVPRDGLPFTSLARTLVDLSAVLVPEELEAALDSAIRLKAGIESEVANTLERLGRSGRTGAGALAALLDRNPTTRTGSPLEIQVRNAMSRAGIPSPMAQLAIDDIYGDQIGIVDFAWPKQRVALQVQSLEFHFSTAILQKDNAQALSYGAVGWRVLPVTHQQLTNHRDRFFDELRAALGCTET